VDLETVTGSPMEGLWKLLPLLLNRPLLLLEILGDLLFWVELELVLGVLDLVLVMEEAMEVGLDLDMELELA